MVVKLYQHTIIICISNFNRLIFTIRLRKPDVPIEPPLEITNNCNYSGEL